MAKSRDSRAVQVVGHIVMVAMVVVIIAPFFLMVVSSLTDNNTLIANGYSFLPAKWSLAAYTYMAEQSFTILHAFMITIFVTAVGTTASLAITSMLAYPLSRRDLPGGNILLVVVVITILFNGGLVPTYILYTHFLGMKNTVWALIVPNLLMNGFNVFLTRTYFVTSIPIALIESAKIDGAGEFFIFWRIVLPLSLPILATIGLLVGIQYWNDWYNGLIYISRPSLFSVQLLLNRMLQDIQFLSSNAQLSSSAAGSTAAIPGTAIRMAIAVVGSLPILAAYPFFQKYFVKGITLGAVKG